MENNIVCEESEQPPSTPSLYFATARTTTILKPLVPSAIEGEKKESIVPARTVNTIDQPYRSSFSLISEKTDEFRRRFYPQIDVRHWQSWRWQLRNRIVSAAQLERLLILTDDEREAIRRHQGPMPISITPYYASLLDPRDPAQPLRRSVVATLDEFRLTPGESFDPLGEEHDSPLPNLVHRYPDRVLFLVTNFCSTYCRYCTRSRVVGKKHERFSSLMHAWQAALDYIAAHPEVRDVLLSGGDPPTLADNRLDWLLDHLRRIPHVEVVRIGTKIPAVLPQRITSSLINVLRRYHPLWMSLHFTHPEELTPETAEACRRLADAGIPLGSQTVLLKGINDSVDTMLALNRGLMKLRVRPYYLYQCDPVPGTAHFRTPVAKGLEIIRGLRGFTSGYAVPHYVIDAPGGGGKIPLLPDYMAGREGDEILLRNYQDRLFHYPDTAQQKADTDAEA
ncbi:MAG: KamA family radical SAM protein [candidate division KSB1 bacterium]|nr:KamA family radical SAM protein [candidate division KSB1 bacterium]